LDSAYPDKRPTHGTIAGNNASWHKDQAIAVQIARRGIFVIPTLTVFDGLMGQSVAPLLVVDRRLAAIHFK
jgi:hypothetical protein